MSNNDYPLSTDQTVRLREKAISCLNSKLKHTFRKVISIISVRAFSFNHRFESFRITSLSLKLVNDRNSDLQHIICSLRHFN